MEPAFTKILEATDFVKPFPEFEDVFGEPLPFHRKHFLPLVSVNTAVVHPDLEFWLHFVTPIEPLLELDIGCFTEAYHDIYNREGQFGFRVVDGRYSFTGHSSYFAYESGAIFKAFEGQDYCLLSTTPGSTTCTKSSGFSRGFALRTKRIPSPLAVS